MSAAVDPLRILDDMITEAVAVGVGHHTAEDERLGGRTVRIHDRDLINFASCSYLGLELDPHVISGVVDAATRYGSQFSSSRVFVSAPAYEQLEQQLVEIFGGDAIATPSTTLGHLATLPVLVGPDDAALLDHHVHNSVQMAAKLVGCAGSTVEMVRHHDLDHLEERVTALRGSHRQIWFMVDGVCSMFGDVAPIAQYRELLDRHEELHLYVDDAHGMSWTGKHGRGYALGHDDLHPRMVLATSLNKAFAAGGGAVVFPNAELRRRVRTCGATLLFSGPIQPPMLGAALASAKIHLDPKILGLQARFAAHTQTCSEILRQTDLPVCSDPRSPVQFVEVGLPQKAQLLAKKLMDDGFFANVAQFPAVPMRRAGIRFTLTLHQREEDLHAIVDSLVRNFDGEEGTTPRISLNGPRLVSPTEVRIVGPTHVRVLPPKAPAPCYRVERARSIRELPEQEWDEVLADRGSFGSRELKLLERTFVEHPDPANRWGFHYYRVIDRAGKTLLATFFTDAIWKGDMLAPASVSRAVERERKNDPLHLTHHVFSMGSLLTEGDHLYLDPELGPAGSTRSRAVLELFLNAVQEDATALECNTIALRDLEDPEGLLDAFLRTQGFISMPLPDSLELEISWQGESEYLASLSPKARYHQKRSVRPFDDAYRAEIFSRRERNANECELDHFYSLYQNVKANNLELNTFDLPRNLWSEVMRDEQWEIIALFANNEPHDAPPVGMGICFIGRDHYVPLIMGLDYRYVRSGGLYRQCMRHTIARARKLGLSKVLLGMGADLEKRRFGATPKQRFLFLQTADHYVFDAVAQLNVASASSDD